jgi:hypothetical protein
MKSTLSRIRGRRRVVAGVATATLLALLLLANAPVSAQQAAPGSSTCPLLNLANPGAGDDVPNGDYEVSGTVLDPVTRSPSGVSHVDFFLGQRDTGGTFLGSTTPGTDPNNPAGFIKEVTFPDVDRLDTFTAYAYATNSAASTTVAVPIQIGNPQRTTAPATPTPVTASVTVKSNCPTASVSPRGSVAVVGAAAPVVAVTSNQGPVLRIANPNAGDFVSRGDYWSFGVGFDQASKQGAGVDAVSYYLEPRDNGGALIGTATPGLLGGELGAYAALLKFPTGAAGGHNLVAYAHSSVSGQESAVSIPIYVGGSRPTATPIP